MSAPEDKISSNRRRLFKALSTAPVVMTLKPGAALANASAFQCAAAVRDQPFSPAPASIGGGQSFGPFNTPNLPDASNPYGLVAETVPRRYVDLKNGIQKRDTTVEPPVPVPCDELPPPDGFAVDYSDVGAGVWYQRRNASNYEGRMRLANAEFVIDPIDGLQLQITNTAGQVCWIVGDVREGYWARAIEMNPTDTSVKNYRDESYPRRQIRVGGGADQNQAITATCLCSVDPNNPIFFCNG